MSLDYRRGVQDLMRNERRETLPGLLRSCCCAVLVAVALATAGCAIAPSPDSAGAAAAAVAAAPIATAPASASATPGAQLQERREWRFAQDGVVFDNRLDGARLNGVERLGNDRYRLHIAPESHPINPSPWYGFQVRADSQRSVEFEFHYDHDYRHRYVPKLSQDGVRWREARGNEFTAGAEGVAARLAVQVGTQPLWVFAQPPMNDEVYATWTDRLAERVSLQRSVIGTSIAGRPLHLLSFGGHAASPVLLVLGRQHPPEITGSQALLGFVDALADDTPQAQAFRRQVRVVVVPVLNPDGVVEGHWRGNLAGADLNRDWGPFAQPETRALRDALQAEVAAGRRIAFAIDFHSTFQDIFYTVSEDPSRAPGGQLRRWIDAMQARFPGRIEEKAFAATTSVFKNWAYCRFGASTVTYEVGDTTPAGELGRVSAYAAEALMGQWPHGHAAPATPPACALPTVEAAAAG